jgi:hypothetical protein
MESASYALLSFYCGMDINPMLFFKFDMQVFKNMKGLGELPSFGSY